MTGIASAYVGHSPVIALSGGIRSSHLYRDAFQELDQVSMFRPVTKLSVQVNRPIAVLNKLQSLILPQEECLARQQRIFRILPFQLSLQLSLLAYRKYYTRRSGCLQPPSHYSEGVSMPKSALVTGITGQDGSYLAELLLEKGYQVFGLIRRSSSPNLNRITHVASQITFLEGDLTDQSSLNLAVQQAQPDEVYNLAAQSFVATSWTQPVLTGDVTGLGAVRLLDAVKQVRKEARFYQASSSEMFGAVTETPQHENTKFHPRSPYACAKVYAHNMAINYRESYDMYVCNGILFNHESERRGLEFVTRKITNGVARIYHGVQHELMLGNLDARRDWGHAADYVDAMWRILQQPQPDDFVIALGEDHSVREFVELAFQEAGLDWEKYVVVDPRFFRPAEVMLLRGDASKARRVLGWEPQVAFPELVRRMVQSDIAAVKAALPDSAG